MVINKKELARILEVEGFRSDAYDLEGGMSPECYCLSFAYGVWSVYYSERGSQTGKKQFNSEDEACKYFLEKLRRDPSTRINKGNNE